MQIWRFHLKIKIFCLNVKSVVLQFIFSAALKTTKQLGAQGKGGGRFMNKNRPPPLRLPISNKNRDAISAQTHILDNNPKSISKGSKLISEKLHINFQKSQVHV